MRDLLFLCHRVPYPPNKGEKIRAWNILQHLAQKHRVHLATFIDRAEDLRHVAKLQSVCASMFWRSLSPIIGRWRSLSSLVSGTPLTQGYFADARFQAGLDGLVSRHKPDLIYVFSSSVAPYVRQHWGARVICDMVDVDSAKWHQYAERSGGLARQIYSREGRLLLALERQVAERADAVLFVSRAEAELFARLAPESASRIHVVNNGVDAEHFCPALSFSNPFGGRPAVVFTGTMDYRPNVEAMEWFVRQVMPRLRLHPLAPNLWIVGANPTRRVRALAGDDVFVTGSVPDVRPYLRHASAVVAPLKIGRGIQNKVLEGMAMGAAVVVTSEAREGLDGCCDDELFTADSAEAFSQAVARILDGEGSRIGVRARARVMRDYAWEGGFAKLDRLIEVVGCGQQPSTVMAKLPLQVSGT
jgi:sugar transferase (PEP-CTERM/EpsH1 system associated)